MLLPSASVVLTHSINSLFFINSDVLLSSLLPVPISRFLEEDEVTPVNSEEINFNSKASFLLSSLLIVFANCSKLKRKIMRAHGEKLPAAKSVNNHKALTFTDGRDCGEY